MVIAQAEVGDVKFRIFRPDDRNFTVERWEPPHIGKRGRGMGNMIEGKWTICGYYPSPQHAARSIINHGVLTIPESFDRVIQILNELEQKLERKFK